MRFFILAFSLLLGFAGLPAAAQNVAPPYGGPPENRADPGPRRSTLDELFERLAKAKDETEAKGIASLIERRWLRSGSDTADLLMSRAAEASEAKNFPLAIELLDRVIALEPGWAEAWYRRANAFFRLDDPVSSLADIYQTLNREPRHFGAWTGLGHIMMMSEDKARALQAFRRALQIYPKLATVRTMVDKLEPEVDGQDL